MRRHHIKVSGLLIASALFLGVTAMFGCVQRHDKEVVVYAALDREFSEAILRDFETETGIHVRAKYDVESNKTVGLANEIIAQQARQRADLFWNNEILHTLRLKKAGLLDVYTTPVTSSYPSNFVSPHRDWFGFAARARVLIVNTDLIPLEKDRPDSIHDLIDPKWKGKCGMARPLFGTTATHAAVLLAEWEEGKAKEYLRAVSKNTVIVGGNKQVATQVSEGRLAFGITDTDDAIIELEKGKPVVIVFPDQGDDQEGTLFIPNTLCLIKDGPNSDHAKELVDYLLSPGVEKRLAECGSAQIPLNGDEPTRSRVEPEAELKFMSVDFQKAANGWETNVKFLNEVFPVGGN